MKVTLLLVPVLALALVGIYGCGKKADPLCPRDISDRGLSGLEVTEEGGSARLTWVCASGVNHVDRVRIYRSSLDRSVENCSGCPRTFMLIAEIERGDSECAGEDRGRCTYVDSSVEKGYRYAYRLSACSAAGWCDDAPGMVEIDF